MILVLKADVEADSPEVRRLIERAESYPGVHTQIHRIQGATRSVTEIYLLGHTGVIPTEPFQEFACVERVVRVTEKYRAIGSHGGRRGAPHQPGRREEQHEDEGEQGSGEAFHRRPSIVARSESRRPSGET